MANRFYTILLIATLPGAVLSLAVFSLAFGLQIGIPAGLIFSMLPAATLAYLLTADRRVHPPLPEFQPDEIIMKEGPANFKQGGSLVRGRLFLTNQRIVFHPGKESDRGFSTTLNHLQQAKPTLTAGSIPNGLRIVLDKGRPLRFIVEERTDWSGRILEAHQKN